MSQELNSAVAVVGIDIGKNSFHIVGHDQRGAIVGSARAVCSRSAVIRMRSSGASPSRTVAERRSTSGCGRRTLKLLCHVTQLRPPSARRTGGLTRWTRWRTGDARSGDGRSKTKEHRLRLSHRPPRCPPDSERKANSATGIQMQIVGAR
jgi:hypothetical protein